MFSSKSSISRPAEEGVHGLPVVQSEWPLPLPLCSDRVRPVFDQLLSNPASPSVPPVMAPHGLHIRWDLGYLGGRTLVSNHIYMRSFNFSYARNKEAKKVYHWLIGLESRWRRGAGKERHSEVASQESQEGRQSLPPASGLRTPSFTGVGRETRAPVNVSGI